MTKKKTIVRKDGDIYLFPTIEEVQAAFPGASRFSDAHEAEMQAVRDRFTKITFCKDAADRAKAEKYVRILYRSMGWKEPDVFVWRDGPCTGTLAFIVARESNNVSEALAAIKDLPTKAEDALKLYAGKFASKEKVAQDGDRLICRGQFEGPYVAFFSYLLEECGLEAYGWFEYLIRIAEATSWWWMMEGMAIMCDRPTHMEFSPNGRRLSNRTGPAIGYRDGYKMYFIDGEAVPARVVTDPQSITVEEVNKARNAEIRRIMTEQMGYDKYLDQAGATIVDQDTMSVVNSKALLPNVVVKELKLGRIARVLMVDKHGMKFVMAADGTDDNQIYTMFVPPECKTVTEAMTRISGLTDENHYAMQS